jgi:phytoene dehydrogenase-like protein
MSAVIGNHDVVVVGAGHNGLVAANYLADAGLDVIIVEADQHVGGMSSSACTIPGAPHHVVNHCAVDPFLWETFPPARELGLHRYGYRTVQVNPAYAYLHPDGASLAFWLDPRRTADEIRHFSPADADAYLDLARLLDALLDLAHPLSMTNPTRPDAKTTLRLARGAFRHRRQLRDLGVFALASGTEVIGERFQHPVVRNALHVLCGGIQTPSRMPATALQLAPLAYLHRFPFVRPIGGMQTLPDALTSRLRAVGGTVLTSAPVAEILLRANRASGVVLEDGTVIPADKAVLTSCDPRQTLERFLPGGTLPPTIESRVRNMPANGGGWGQLKIDIAFSGHLDLSRHNRMRRDGLNLREPSHFIGTEEGMERAYRRCAAGLMPDENDISLWTAIPTALDPSQAPQGQDSLYLYASTVPFEPEDGWKTLKEPAAQAVVSKAAQFYGGIAELEIGRQVQTNEDIAEWRRATNGCILHVDWGLNRCGPLRPARGLGGFRTPVEGLYLGGSGSHPGGGVTGMPGYLGAREVIRALRRPERKRVLHRAVAS